MTLSESEIKEIAARAAETVVKQYKECEDLVTLLDDGVIWLETAEEIRDMQYTSNLKGLSDLDYCFFVKTSLKKALGSLDVAARPGEELHRGYITNEEYAKAEELIKPLENTCNLPHEESRKLFSEAIKHVRELMAIRSCQCLISGVESVKQKSPETSIRHSQKNI